MEERQQRRKRVNYARLADLGIKESTDGPQYSLSCLSCQKKISIVSTFLNHISHCPAVKYQCPICENNTENDDVYQEDDLETSFSSALELDSHITEQHPDCYPFRCYICEVKFSSLLVLQKHQLSNHKICPHTIYVEPKASFPCTGCLEHFESANELADHFTSQPQCAGSLMLWQCVDPVTDDEEDDVVLRLRECFAIEEEFNNRFPTARMGLDIIPGIQERPIRVSAPTNQSRSVNRPYVPGQRGRPPKYYTAAFQSQGRPQHSATKTYASSSDIDDIIKQVISKEYSPSYHGSYGTNSLSKKVSKMKSQTTKMKMYRSAQGQREIANAAAEINKRNEKRLFKSKKRSQLALSSPGKMNLHHEYVEDENESPKRRKMMGDDMDDDVMSSPDAPFGVQGTSPGLEPEDDDDDMDGPPSVEPLGEIGALASEIASEADDSRVAHAVELNVCKACGESFDSQNDYMDHMQLVHNLDLPFSTGRARGRPKKKSGEENEVTYFMKNAIDNAVKQVNRILVDSHTLYDSKPPPKKRGRKPKTANLGLGDGIVKSEFSSAPLLCPLCSDRPAFESCDEREGHLASMHDGERAFGCQACGETFSLFYELQLHTRQEHDIGSAPPVVIEDPARAKLAYKCVVCKVGFQDESILQRHYDAMHTLDEGEQYHCPVCYFTYSGCRTRDDHVLKKHPEARAFKCPVCEARFASFEVFRAHEKRAHISQKTRLRSGMSGNVENAHVMLGLTEKPKKPRRKLAAAMRGALGEKSNETSSQAIAEKRRKLQNMYKEGTLYCDKCNEDCANEEELDIHTKEHIRKEKRFGCTQCGRVFSGPLARSFLVDHIKLEHMHQSAYACDDCGQRFYFKVQADRHRMVDRDSGVSSCRRIEDLNIPLPRIVFGCSRCAKIFAGDGAQSRYTEHQQECISSSPSQANAQARKEPPPLPPPPPQSPTPNEMSPAPLLRVKEDNEVAIAISEAVDVIGNPMVDNESEVSHDQQNQHSDQTVESSQEFVADDSNIGMIVSDDVVQQQSSQDGVHENQQTVIVLPSNSGQDGDEGQVVVLPEDVLSNVRASGDESVVLIQAEDGTLIVASEEQLAELQMQESANNRSTVGEMLQGAIGKDDEDETVTG